MSLTSPPNGYAPSFDDAPKLWSTLKLYVCACPATPRAIVNISPAQIRARINYSGVFIFAGDTYTRQGIATNPILRPSNPSVKQVRPKVPPSVGAHPLLRALDNPLLSSIIPRLLKTSSKCYPV